MRHLLLLLFIALPALETSAAQTTPAWRMTEEQIKSLAFRLSAGKSLQPDGWPGGARVAVLLSFDVDSQTWELMNGGVPSLSDLSQGEYSARVGLKRVTAFLAQQRIPATFFVPAVSIVLHPEIVDVIEASRMHEIGVHGWIHEHPTSLSSAEEEEELMIRSMEIIEKHTGVRPVGYRAPGYDVGPHTIGILRKLGFLYDSSLMADERPYEINENGKPTGLVELPVEWMRDDATLVDPRGDNYTAPRELLEVLIDEFDKAYEEKTLFVLTTHPRVIGHRSRIVILEKLVSHMRTKGNVWFATYQQAAEYVKECGLKASPPPP